MTSLTLKCKRNNTWDVFLSCLHFFFGGGWVVGVGRGFSATGCAVFLLESCFHKPVSKWLRGEFFCSQSRQRLDNMLGEMQMGTSVVALHFELVWSPHLPCGPRVCPAVRLWLPYWEGARVAGWRGHLFRSVLAGTGPCWEMEREGVVLFPQDYLYPALVQSGRFVDGKQALVEEKVLPDQMLSAFCSSSLIAAMCERVWGTAFLSWGSRLKLSLGRLATFCKEQISVSQVWKNNVPGHEYHLPHDQRAPLVVRWGARGQDWGRHRGCSSTVRAWLSQPPKLPGGAGMQGSGARIPFLMNVLVQFSGMWIMAGEWHFVFHSRW